MNKPNAPQLRSSVDWRLQLEENNKVNKLINSSLRGIRDTGKDLLNMAGRDERKLVAQDKRDYQDNALAAMTSANTQKELSDIYAKASENKMVDVGKLQGILQKKENQIRANEDSLANRNRIIDMYNTKQEQHELDRRDNYDARVLANEWKIANSKQSIFNQDRNYAAQQELLAYNRQQNAIQSSIDYQKQQAAQKGWLDAIGNNDVAARVVSDMNGDANTYQLLKIYLNNHDGAFGIGGIDQDSYKEVKNALLKMTKG